jgi:hypothetical protein
MSVDAHYKGHTQQTDQPQKSGGSDTAPSPFDLFMISIATCMGLYALRFCQERDIPTDDLRLSLDPIRDEWKKMVATVDSLARSDVAARMNPARPPAGDFAVAGEGDAIVLGAANFARYAPWVELVDSLDAQSTAALYRRLYPQFQAAYEHLGNPDRYFNDRVVEVIDHLLSAPEGPATIPLVRPNVFYEFADPALERQSAGRKLLLRMGPGNAARVKAKLREVRGLIAAQP